MSTSDNTTTSVLEVRDLHVEVANSDANAEPIQILKGVDLTVRSGETHAIMGPNGSGKSTLSYAIAGHPKYQVTSGSITLNGEDVLAMSVDERARAGLFLAMQYPVEVPGVSMSNFLRTAATAVRGEAPKLRHWVKEVKEALSELEIDPSFIERSVNEGFSGGEKKRHEILQLGMLKPKIAILDETDSGLDVDALRTVSEGVNRYKERENGGVLLITHYTRILRYINPTSFTCSSVAASSSPVDRSWPTSSRPTATFVSPRTPQLPRERNHDDHLGARARRHSGSGRLPDPGANRARRKTFGVLGFRRYLAASGPGTRCRTGLPDHV